MIFVPLEEQIGGKRNEAMLQKSNSCKETLLKKKSIMHTLSKEFGV